MLVALCLGMTVGAGGPVSAGQERDAPAQADRMTFDIPAQPLVSALEAYGAATDREVLYNARLATGRTSAELKGRFTPEAALRRLLGGTGLTARYTSDTSFVLTPGTPEVAGEPDSAAMAAAGDLNARFYGLLQERIRGAFCENAVTRPGRYRAALRLWIGPAGTVQRFKLLDTTGDRSLDEAIGKTLHGLRVGAAPPPGLVQPFTMVILPRPPQVTNDCASADRTFH